MGRKDKIKEERIKYWIKFLSVFLVVSIACLFVIFYIYNKNIMEESNMKLDELASIERIVLNDDESAYVSTSEDKTIKDVKNITNTSIINTSTNGTNVLTANVISNEISEDDHKNLKIEKEKEEYNDIKKENIAKENNSNEIELSKINAIQSENETENKDNIENKTNTVEVVSTENNTSTENVIELNFESPLSGEIIKDYAKDTLVYSKTLEEWCVHLGVDIKAPKTTVVKAAEKGVIEKITTDPRYGNSITINHGNGFKTVYSSLLVSDFFKVGEEVQKGDNIGTVGDSANFEKADDAHLHFEMYKDGENVNPTIYLK